MKHTKTTFECNATAFGTEQEVEKIKAVIMNDETLKSFTNKQLLKYKLELSEHQTNAIMLQEFFVPKQKAYGVANSAKIVIEIITDELRERYQKLIAIKNYFYERNKENWYAIMEEIEKMNK